MHKNDNNCYFELSFPFRRREKQSSSFCSKVLSPSPAADANTHINKDYAQNGDSYRPNGLPRRRGLPYEVNYS